MTYDARAIANELLNIAKEHNAPITPMKLQKLMYYAYGHYLAAHNQRLFNEDIQAWKYGPVVPSIYSDFKDFGNTPIDALATTIVREEKGPAQRIVMLGDDSHANQVREFLREVWDAYGGYSAARLSNATHQPGTPWDATVKMGGYQDIEDNIIESYFAALT